MPDLVIEVLNQLADHDDPPANRRTASTLVPGIKRASHLRPIPAKEESSDVNLQIHMPTAMTQPTEPDPGPFEIDQNPSPTDGIESDDVPTTERVARDVSNYLGKTDKISIHNMSIKRATLGVPAEDAITHEVTQMLDLVSRSSLTPEQRAKTIRSSMFLKEFKFLPSGRR